MPILSRFFNEENFNHVLKTQPQRLTKDPGFAFLEWFVNVKCQMCQCSPCSFLMKKMDAEKIKARLESGHNVQAEMTWSLPAPDDRVEWSLWTSAMDTSAAVRFFFFFFFFVVGCGRGCCRRF